MKIGWAPKRGKGRESPNVCEHFVISEVNEIDPRDIIDYDLKVQLIHHRGFGDADSTQKTTTDRHFGGESN